MADAHAKHHDYHLVDPSAWPAIGAVAAFVAAVGAISWMHHLFAAAPIVFGIGVAGILYTMMGWWRDVIREAETRAIIPGWCNCITVTGCCCSSPPR